MRRFTTLMVMLGGFILATSVWADSPSYAKGSPTGGCSGNTYTGCATITGLGNSVIDVTVTCNVSFQCKNKANNFDDSGKVSTTQAFVPHNGVTKNACVSVAATCPPGQMGPSNVEFTACTYTVTEDSSTLLGPTDLPNCPQ